MEIVVAYDCDTGNITMRETASVDQTSLACRLRTGNALQMTSTRTERKSRTLTESSCFRYGLRSLTARLFGFCQFEIANFFGRNTDSKNYQEQHTNDNMAEKKRKRNEEVAERPSKKTAVAPSGNVKVELLQEEALGPVLGMAHCTLSGQWRLTKEQLQHRVSSFPRASASSRISTPRFSQRVLSLRSSSSPPITPASTTPHSKSRMEARGVSSRTMSAYSTLKRRS